MRHPPLRRLVAGLGSVALVLGVFSGLGVLAQAATTAVAGATQAPDCTVNGTANQVVNGSLVPFDLGGTVTPGTTTVTIACSGLPTSVTTLAIAVASPLAGFLAPADQTISNEEDLLMGSPTLLSTTCTSTACSLASTTFTIPSTTTAANSDGKCPPTPAQVQVGLTNCTLAVADTSGNQYALDYLNYPNQPTPSAPSVTVTPATVAAGDAVSLSGSGFWGDPEGTTSGQAVSVTVTDSTGVTKALTTNAISIAADVYTTGSGTNGSGGTLTGGSFSATTEDLPSSGLASGTLTYSVAEPNVAPFNDPPYDTATATCSSTCPLPSSTNPPNPAAAVGTATNTLLGTPTLTVSPTSGGVGTVVSITGTNWDPQGSKVTVAFTTAATGKTVDSVTLSVTSSGDISGSISVTSNEAVGSNPLDGTQTAFDGSTLTATAAFTVTAISSTCSIGGTTGLTSCSVQQVISVTITGTNLTITEETTGSNPNATTVVLTPITLGPQVFQNATGKLNTVQVSDDRGTLVGWTVTATMDSNFTNSSPTGNSIDNEIPASFLTWTPSVSLTTPGSTDIGTFCPGSPTSPGENGCVGPSGQISTTQASGVATTSTPAEVTAGPVANLSTTTAATLCSAAAGGGGGGFNCNASLSLATPPYVAAGTYSATMNITVS